LFPLVSEVFGSILKPSKTEKLVNQPTIWRLESESSRPRNTWVLFLSLEDEISRSVWGVHVVDASPGDGGDLTIDHLGGPRANLGRSQRSGGFTTI
jgi:hypothetical protein